MTKALMLVLAAGLLLTGCQKVEESIQPEVRVQVEETRTWAVSEMNKLLLGNVNGDMHVNGLSKCKSVVANITRYSIGTDSADAMLWLDSVRVTCKVLRDMFELRAEVPDSLGERNVGADFDVSLPAGKALIVLPVNGPTLIRGMTAPVGVTGWHGNITLRELQGGVGVMTINSEVDCDLTSLQAPAAARLQTLNGNILLSVPAEISARFVAKSESGSVTVSGFTNLRYTTNQEGHKAGTIGSGDAVIDLSSWNGDITLKTR